MLFQIRQRCPHCGNTADFVLSQFTEVTVRPPDPSRPLLIPNPLPPRQRLGGPAKVPASQVREACGLSRCPLCSGPLLLVFYCTPDALKRAREATTQLRSADRIIAPEELVVVATYPAAPTHQAHPTWPLKVQKPFVDLQEMLEQNRHPSFIIGGSRSILDVATKELGAGEGTLNKRIDALAERNVVTGVLRDWSHELRIDGNAAVHELEGDEDMARQMVEFLKLFLHVTFELPAAIEAKRRKDEAEKPGEDLVTSIVEAVETGG